ncbi:MAG: hypothetical protein ACYCS1_09190 [Gammaproteobacteria bacterium]
MHSPLFYPSLFAGNIWGILGLLVGLVIYILYLITLMKTLQAVSPSARRLEPGLVFLLLIPLFNLVWNFFVVIKIRDSLKTEFASRNLPSEGFGFGVGMAMSVLVALSLIPVVGLLTGLAGFICWILYWIQMSGYRQRLSQH